MSIKSITVKNKKGTKYVIKKKTNNINYGKPKRIA